MAGIKTISVRILSGTIRFLIVNRPGYAEVWVQLSGTIENNHIYNIWTKRQFTGAEIGGIKFHAAIDAVVRNNRIHDTGRGMWFDWMTQGTRVSCNLLYNNDLEDLFFEVNHGPFIVDNNILLSPYAIRTQSEGGAYLHNLVAGAVQIWPDPNRFTPYFLPHSTSMAGLTTIYGGDDRYFNNIFVGIGNQPDKNSKINYGTAIYNNARLPVRMSGNSFYFGAKPSDKEQNFVESPDFNPELKLKDEGDHVYLNLTFDQKYYDHTGDLITSELLGNAKIPRARFENADGTPFLLNSDYFGNARTSENAVSGPFVNLEKGNITLKVW